MNHQDLLSKKCIKFLGFVMVFICLAALIVPTPGHDTSYWISRLYLFGEEIRANGIWKFPYYIYSDCYNGYGYALPMFYCDVFLLFPAVMVALGLPVNMAYSFALAFFLALRFGLSFGAVKIALSQNELETTVQPEGQSEQDWHNRRLNQCGLLFAFLYSVFPYMLDNAFERGALGELIAGAFLPLIFACIYRIIHRENVPKRICLWLAFGLSGVLCSHVVTTVLVAVVITVYVMIKMPVLWKKKKRLWMLVQSALMAVCLSAFWLFPFLEQFLVGSPGVAEGTPEYYALGIKTWFLPTELRDAFRLYILDDYNTVFKWEPSGFVYPLLLAVVLWVRFRKVLENKTIKRCLLVAWGLVIGISCKPLIRLLAVPLGLVQFPWRILWLVALLTAIFLTYALAKINRKGWTYLTIAVCLGCAAATSGIAWVRQVRFQEPIPNYKELGMDTLYLPEGAWWQMAGERGEVVDATQTGVQYTWERQDEEILLDYSGNSGQVTFRLPLHYYLGYTAYDMINECDLEVTASDVGLVSVTVDGFDSGSIRVAYTGTVIQKFAKVLSILAWLGVLVYAAVSARAERSDRKTVGKKQE